MQREVTVDEVIAATSGDAPVHPKKRKRLEKLSSEQLIAYQLRTLLINACRVCPSYIIRFILLTCEC